MSGLFITFEGIEGCGKSTQIKLLADFLTELGHDVVLTREPGGTPLAEAMRNLLLDRRDEAVAPLAELLLYEAARAQHVNTLILPALARDAVVLCDRFADSTTAYQGAGRHLAEDFIALLNRLTAGAAWPNRTFLLDLPAEDGLQRAHARGSDDRMMTEAIAFHQRIRTEFLDIARRDPKRVTVIDGNRPVETIQQELRQQVAAMPQLRQLAQARKKRAKRTPS